MLWGRASRGFDAPPLFDPKQRFQSGVGQSKPSTVAVVCTEGVAVLHAPFWKNWLRRMLLCTGPLPQVNPAWILRGRLLDSWVTWAVHFSFAVSLHWPSTDPEGLRETKLPLLLPRDQ